MKVTYIHHSCFIVELEDCILIFDYYKGELPEFDKDKRIIFFVSHNHGDHFNPDIYKYADYDSHVTYVISSDVRQSLSFAVRIGTGGQSTIFVDEDKKIYLNVDNRGISKTSGGLRDMMIETLKSTDEGVAFIIEYAGKSIYFAGDLHWWSWIGDEDSEEKRREAEYKKEMAKIKNRHFDMAFVVLDPRQEEHYWWGFNEFMTTADADIVFPMHFWKNYKLIENLKNENIAEPYKEKVKMISYEGEVFEI
ncbi:MAG: MBL fold metallo-hydrolase [Clostridia bacterium]|nr:MBL fold metallo-hydrolase [Clostridia bacterium]